MPDPVNTFIIDEDIHRGLRVELRDSDMPYGRARELAAFETGGKFEIAENGIYNPGSDRVVLQMMQPKERPLVLKGAFRDRLFGPTAGQQEDGSSAAQTGSIRSGHAREMRNVLERIRRRANPLKLSWGGDTRMGVLWETKFGEQGLFDIEYELTFFITSPPENVPLKSTTLTSKASSIEDLRGEMQAQLAAAKAQQLASALTVAVSAVLSNGFDSVGQALDSLGQATTAMERISGSTPHRLISGANAVLAGAQSVKTAALDLRFSVDTFRADDAVVYNKDTAAIAGYWAAAAEAEAFLDQLFDTMRQIMLQTRQRIKSATRLYKVQFGDTLESIAMQQLGGKGRAQELGISPSSLVPGQYVRIPQAS